MTTETIEPTRLRPGAARGVSRPAKRRAKPTPALPPAPHPLLELAPRRTPWEAREACGVEELVAWTYGDQGVGSLLQGSLDLDAYGPSLGGLDSCEKVARIAAVGCAIDVSRGPSSAEFHPVALAVDQAVAELEDAALVRRFGKLGTRPDGWRIPKRFLAPEQWEEYEVEAMTLSGREGRGGLPLPYCPIVVVASIETIAENRMRYVRWWSALELLFWRLSHRALGFYLEPLRAPAAPWEAEAAQTERATER